MKVLTLADIHIRDTAPRTRTDNFPETLFSKFSWCLELARKEKCDAILIAGDIFHSVRTSYESIAKFIQIVKEHNKNNHSPKIYLIAGQHDLRNHTVDIKNTPLAILNKTNVISILKNKEPYIYDNSDIYGCGWKEEIPKVIDKKRFNILVLHRMVVESNVLFPGQTNLIKAEDLLKDNDFDLIISGDNHQHFISSYNGKYLINCGSLMRSNSNQINHHPKCVIFDTTLRTMHIYDIPVQPYNIVFDLDKVEKDKKVKEDNLAAGRFVDLLSNNQEEFSFNFVNNIEKTIKEESIKSEISDFLYSWLKEKAEQA